MISRMRPRLQRVYTSLGYFVLLFAITGGLARAAKLDFQVGKLIDITADERLTKGTTIRWAVFTVQVGDIVYTATGERLRRQDAGKGLIVGDAVQVAIDRDNLVLQTPNGKSLKTKITKRSRAT
jgi:hypothetical protein